MKKTQLETQTENMLSSLAGLPAGLSGTELLKISRKSLAIARGTTSLLIERGEIVPILFQMAVPFGIRTTTYLSLSGFRQMYPTTSIGPLLVPEAALSQLHGSDYKQALSFMEQFHMFHVTSSPRNRPSPTLTPVLIHPGYMGPIPLRPDDHKDLGWFHDPISDYKYGIGFQLRYLCLESAQIIIQQENRHFDVGLLSPRFTTQRINTYTPRGVLT